MLDDIEAKSPNQHPNNDTESVQSEIEEISEDIPEIIDNNEEESEEGPFEMRKSSRERTETERLDPTWGSQSYFQAAKKPGKINFF